MGFEACIQNVIKQTPLACWDTSRENEGAYRSRILNAADRINNGLQECADQFGMDRGGLFKDATFNSQQFRISQLLTDQIIYCPSVSQNSRDSRSQAPQMQLGWLHSEFFERFLQIDAAEIKEVVMSGIGLALGLTAWASTNSEIMSGVLLSPVARTSLTVLTGVAGLTMFFYPDIRRSQANFTRHYPLISNHNASELGMLSGLALASVGLSYSKNLLNLTVPNNVWKGAILAASSIVLGVCAYAAHQYIYSE